MLRWALGKTKRIVTDALRQTGQPVVVRQYLQSMAEVPIECIADISPKTVSLVGNGPIDTEPADQIDAADLVIRFNRAVHYGTSGIRNDIHVLVNQGSAGRSLALSSPVKSGVKPAALSAAKQLLFTHPREMLARWVTKGTIPPDSDWTDALIDKAQQTPYAFLPESAAKEAKVLLQSLGAPADKKPSTGIRVLYHMLKIWPDATFSLYGFSHNGIHPHPWEAEKAWVDKLVASGRVVRDSAIMALYWIAGFIPILGSSLIQSLTADTDCIWPCAVDGLSLGVALL
jgi:Glycosyltransferase family 29 (sialyltransferase)